MLFRKVEIITIKGNVLAVFVWVHKEDPGFQFQVLLHNPKCRQNIKRAVVISG